MISIDGTKIEMTRGDTLEITLSLVDEEGNAYTPTADDKIYFRVKKTLEGEVLIEKEIPVDTMILLLSNTDTEDLIFWNYRYEIELVTNTGYHYTVIANATLSITAELEDHNSE